MKEIFLAALIAVSALEVEAGEYNWTVKRVIDGDTIVMQEKFFPSEIGNIYVRLKGIDTPEKGRFAKCDQEKLMSMAATAFLTKHVYAGTKVVVKNVEKDKYGGRVVADVYVDQENLGDIMIREGFAKPYDGGKKDSWCD